MINNDLIGVNLTFDGIKDYLTATSINYYYNYDESENYDKFVIWKYETEMNFMDWTKKNDMAKYIGLPCDFLSFDKYYNDLNFPEEDDMVYTAYDLLAGRVFVFALPGVEKENLSVYVNDEEIIIEAKRDLSNKNAREINENFKLNQEYKHSFFIDDDFDLKKIETNLRNGVLEIFIPFKNEKVFKKIEVK